MKILLNDRRGVAAVEFAIVTSLFLLPLYLGMLEAVTIYHVQAKLSAVTGYMAQIVSLQSPATGLTNGVYVIPALGTTSATLQDACNGAIKSMAPYPVNGMGINVASVTQQSGPNGLPQSNTTVYTTPATYDVWEQDFTVAGGSCVPGSTATIGLANAITLATSSPAGLTNTPASSVMVNFPCDNAIIVKATVLYPGPLGRILLTRPTLASTSYARWMFSAAQNELKATGSTVQTSYAGTQVCNSANTATN